MDTDNESAMLMLHNYSEKCQIDIFMPLYMLDYVDHDKVDPYLNVVEVYRKISEVKQFRLINGRLMTDTHDKIFGKFSEISVSLLDNASTWTLQLCSSYLSGLTSDLSEAVTSEKNFCHA